ncbi:unnamed protein product, partial [Prorocentrum cordatum]
PAAEPVVEFALRTFAFGLFLRPGRAAPPDDGGPPPGAPEEAAGAGGGGEGEGAAGDAEGRWEAVRVPAEIAGAPGFTTLACRRHCCLGITPEGDVHRWDAAGRGAGVLACGFGVEWSLLVLKDEAGQRVQLRDVGIGYPSPGGTRNAPASSSTSPARSQTGSRQGPGSAPRSPSGSQAASPPRGARTEEGTFPTSPAAAGGGGSPQGAGGGAACDEHARRLGQTPAGGQQPRVHAVGAIALMDSGEVYTTEVFHSGVAADGCDGASGAWLGPSTLAHGSALGEAQPLGSVRGAAVGARASAYRLAQRLVNQRAQAKERCLALPSMLESLFGNACFLMRSLDASETVDGDIDATGSSFSAPSAHAAFLPPGQIHAELYDLSVAEWARGRTGWRYEKENTSEVKTRGMRRNGRDAMTLDGGDEKNILWPMAIGNVLRITPELFQIHKQQALDARRAEAAAAANVLITLSDPPRSHGRERSIECISGSDCGRMLEAYTFFRPDIGYVQGMSFLAAVLLLYLPPYPAFVGLCNLLNSPSVLGLYRLEPGCVECRAEVFRQLCAAQMPAVARVIEEAGLRPEMFLIEWFMTLYSKCLPIDVASVIWDLFLLDGEVVLYCAGLALLRVSEQELLAGGGADLEGCARILGEELRERANDPDELLWQLSEAERRAPPQLLAEIRSIENAEFGSTPLPGRAGVLGAGAVAAGAAGAPGAGASLGSPGAGSLAGAAAPPLQRGLAAVSALRDSIVSRWR